MKADEVWAFDGEFLYVADPEEGFRRFNIARVARTTMGGETVEEDEGNGKRLELAALAPEMFRMLEAVARGCLVIPEIATLLAKVEGR